jgi:hypothetical protein
VKTRVFIILSSHFARNLKRALDLGFCCVDQPQFKSLLLPVAAATGSVARWPDQKDITGFS